jgi:hypothetical protein
MLPTLIDYGALPKRIGKTLPVLRQQLSHARDGVHMIAPDNLLLECIKFATQASHFWQPPLRSS